MTGLGASVNVATAMTAASHQSSPDLGRRALCSLIASELLHSQVLEHWASCFLQLLLCDEDGEGWPSHIDVLFCFIDAGITLCGSSIAVRHSFDAASGPALGFLWSALAVRLAAALDGGPLYGMPEEVVRALPLVGLEPAARPDSRTLPVYALRAVALCGGMLRYNLMVEEAERTEAQVARGRRLGSADAAAGVDPTVRHERRGAPSPCTLPCRPWQLYGLCMRLARSGIAAWGGRQQGGAAGGAGASPAVAAASWSGASPAAAAASGSGAPPAAAASSGSGAVRAVASTSKQHARSAPPRPAQFKLSKQVAMELVFAAVQCAEAALKVRSVQAEAAAQAKAAPAGTGVRAQSGSAADADSHVGTGPAAADGEGAGAGGAGAGPGIPRLRLAALEEWTQVLADACVLMVGEQVTSTIAAAQRTKHMAEWLMHMRAQAVRLLLRARRQSVADAGAAVAAALATWEDAVSGRDELLALMESEALALAKLSEVIAATSAANGQLLAYRTVWPAVGHMLRAVVDEATAAIEEQTAGLDRCKARQGTCARLWA